LNKLRDRAASREKLERTLQSELQSAAAAGDEVKMRELVDGHFAAVQTLATEQLFDQYLSAAVAGEKKQADQYLWGINRIGRLISENKGDRFVNDSVDFASRSGLAVKRTIQSIRQTLEQARKEHARGNTGAACELYEKARSVAERIEDYPHAEIAAL